MKSTMKGTKTKNTGKHMVVANVNKQGKTRSSRKREQKDEDAMPSTSAKKVKLPKVKNVTQTEFQEGDQLISMSTEGMESDFQSTEEDSSDEEDEQIIFNAKSPTSKNARCDESSEEEEELDYNDDEEIQDEQFAEMIEQTYPMDQMEDEATSQNSNRRISLADLTKEDRQQIVGETFAKVQELMEKNQYGQNEIQTNDQRKGKDTRRVISNQNNHATVKGVDSLSEATIYKRVVRNDTKSPDADKCNSSSSEEDNINDKINSSDELIAEGSERLIEQFIADQRQTATGDVRQIQGNRQQGRVLVNYVDDGQQPSTSRQGGGDREVDA